MVNVGSPSKKARLAQSVEHETLNLRVVGSSPTLGEIFFPLSFFMQIAVPPDTANSHAEILNESNEPV